MREDVKRTIDDYVIKRYQPGSFIRSVLENDLMGAFAKADEDNILDMHQIVKYVYNNLPSAAWGSRDIVDRWLNEATDKDVPRDYPKWYPLSLFK
jgi:hypothetical protein